MKGLPHLDVLVAAVNEIQVRDREMNLRKTILEYTGLSTPVRTVAPC